ncbi:immunity protein Tsi6 family protein [Acidiphilium sp.]|uniref:immunity protein Tsi6 family protein n=1 Tax=Acidiphilium sp. TaxID=527 RepID=UPI003D01B947
MDIGGLEPDLAEALQRCESLLDGRSGLQPLVSIRNQLIYLQQVCAGTAGPERLAEIILGLLAVREIEGWDDELADLLHSIQTAVNRRATPLA